MKKNRAIAIFQNTVSNYMRQTVQILVFLVLTPLIASKLGTERFGLWSLIQATVGLSGLLDFGFSTSVVKYVADARGRGDRDRLSSLIATFFWLYVGLGGLLVLAALGFAPHFAPLLKIPAEHAGAARVVFVLIAFRFALAMPLGMFAGVMAGYQKQWLANTVKSAGMILYGALAGWAILSRPSIETLAWISMLTNTAACVFGLFLCAVKLDGFSISPWRIRFRLLPEVTSFSLFFFIVQVSALIYTRVDLIIVQGYLSLAAVALYGIASRLTGQASLFCRQMTNALTPMIAELKGAREESNIRAVFLKGSKLSVAMAVPLLAGLFYLSGDLLITWMGDEFAGATTATRVLIAAVFVSVLHANAANVLSMTGRHKFVSACFIGGQLLNLGLTLTLVLRMGLPGVALATLVSSLIVDVAFIQRQAGRHYGISLPSFYRHALWPSIPGCALMIYALWCLEFAIAPTSLVAIALLEAIGCGVFAVGFVIFGLDEEERRYFVGRFRRLVGRGRGGKEPAYAGGGPSTGEGR